MTKSRKEPLIKRFVERYCVKFIREAVERDMREKFDAHEIKLMGMDYKFARNIFVDNELVKFDAVYECEFTFDDGFEVIKDKRWLRVKCKCEIAETLSHFEVMQIVQYRKCNDKSSHTENFIPIIHSEELDGIATAFLKKYCPMVLRDPMPVPIAEIATEQLGLNIVHSHSLSEGLKVLGQICFLDTEVAIGSQRVKFERGTILIDSEVLTKRNLGCVNFTVAHEVVHWVLHRLRADVCRLVGADDCVAQRCPMPRTIPRDASEGWDDPRRLEWQANSIAARILMPMKTLEMKMGEVTDSLCNAPSKATFYKVLVDKLAKFYGVSKQMVKYRLTELGDGEANNIQLNKYDFEAFTHKIDNQKAFHEYCTNQQLKQLVDSGLFTYVDDYFVINHDKFRHISPNGTMCLTDLAKGNITKCTIKFENRRVKVADYPNIFSDSLNRNAYDNKPIYEYDKNRDTIEYAKQQAQEFSDTKPFRISNSTTFKDFFAKKCEDCGIITSAEFEERTWLSRDMFSKLKSSDKKVSLETAVCVCAGFDLPSKQSEWLLELAGYVLNDTETQQAYKWILGDRFKGTSLEVRNAFLEQNGFEPLGKKEYVNAFA